MKILSPEVTRLLDKLYNLRGSDSVIFKEMESATMRTCNGNLRRFGGDKPIVSKRAVKPTCFSERVCGTPVKLPRSGVDSRDDESVSASAAETRLFSKL